MFEVVFGVSRFAVDGRDVLSFSFLGHHGWNSWFFNLVQGIRDKGFIRKGKQNSLSGLRGTGYRLMREMLEEAKTWGWIAPAAHEEG
jgi:hypothetical protein